MSKGPGISRTRRALIIFVSSQKEPPAASSPVLERTTERVELWARDPETAAVWSEMLEADGVVEVFRSKDARYYDPVQLTKAEVKAGQRDRDRVVAVCGKLFNVDAGELSSREAAFVLACHIKKENPLSVEPNVVARILHGSHREPDLGNSRKIKSRLKRKLQVELGTEAASPAPAAAPEGAAQEPSTPGVDDVSTPWAAGDRDADPVDIAADSSPSTDRRPGDVAIDGWAPGRGDAAPHADVRRWPRVIAIVACTGVGSLLWLAWGQVTSYVGRAVAYADCEPSVADVQPRTAWHGQRTVFTAQGHCLPPSTKPWSGSCRDLNIEEYAPTRVSFSCTPDYDIGIFDGVVKDGPGGRSLFDWRAHVMAKPRLSLPTCSMGFGLYCGARFGLEKDRLFRCVDGEVYQVQTCGSGHCLMREPGGEDRCIP